MTICVLLPRRRASSWRIVRLGPNRSEHRDKRGREQYDERQVYREKADNQSHHGQVDCARYGVTAKQAGKPADALRLLFILHAGARSPEGSEAPAGVAGVFEGEKRLMAIDLWVRYPDYLADQLLNIYEPTKDPALIGQIRTIFNLDERDVRTI
jgi:hypothetical protein